MRCGRCGGITKVLDSRSVEEGTFRKRLCEGCGRVFYTAEYEEDEGNEGIKAFWKDWRMKHVR